MVQPMRRAFAFVKQVLAAAGVVDGRCRGSRAQVGPESARRVAAGEQLA